MAVTSKTGVFDLIVDYITVDMFYTDCSRSLNRDVVVCFIAIKRS